MNSVKQWKREAFLMRKGLIIAGMIFLVLTGSFFMPMAPRADAAIITESGSYSGGVTGVGLDPASAGAATISVSQFNSALGTLTGVTFTLTGTFAGTWHVQNMDGASQVLKWGQDGYVGISYSGMQLSSWGHSPTPPSPYTTFWDWYGSDDFLNARKAMSATNPIPVDGTIHSGDALRFSQSQTFTFTSPGILAAFIGNGTLPFTLTGLQGTVTAMGGGNYAHLGIDTAINGTVTAQYQYTPVPVPPAFLLLGPGLVGLAVLKRKYIG